MGGHDELDIGKEPCKDGHDLLLKFNMEVCFNLINEDNPLQIVAALGFHAHHEVADNVKHRGISCGHCVEIKRFPIVHQN